VIYRLRNKLGEDLELYDKNDFKFCWIVDFPLFEFNEETEKGRAQKKYSITTKGKHKLADIRSEWEKKFDLLNSLMPQSGDIRDNIKKHYQNIQEQIYLGKSKGEIQGFFESYKIYMKEINKKSYSIVKLIEEIITILDQINDYTPGDLTEIISEKTTWKEIFSLVDSNQPFDFQIYHWLSGLDNITAPFGSKKDGDKEKKDN